MSVVCILLGQNGVVGYHQTTSDQLFLVMEGAGWVRGESPEHVPITAGQAAFWETGEWHESGTDNGMVAMIVQGDGFQFDREMQELDRM